jgi:hypothetical protein
LPLVLLLGFTLNALSAGAAPWWTLIPLMLAVLLFVWIVAGTWYAFEGASLVVRCGPFRWRVPLEQIYAVHESNSVRSGPALSMQRLEIRYADQRRMLISPRDQAGFLRELRHQAPQLSHRQAAKPGEI